MTTLQTLGATIDSARHPEDLFGVLAGNSAEQLLELKHVYRKIVEVIHPDKYSASAEAERARDAFVKATALREYAERKIQSGTYGDRTRTAARKDPDPPHGSLNSSRRTFKIGRNIAQGDLCDVYEVSFTETETSVATPKKDKKSRTAWAALMDDDDPVNNGPSERKAFLKLALSAADNDLVENEARVLAKLYPEEQADVKFYRYLPKLLDTVIYKGRRGNVFSHNEGLFPLSDIRVVYPKGLDYRDVVWMFKRMLVGVGFAHTKGVVHGAIIPPHVLVHPTHHGARIIDWSYAVADKKGHVPAICKTYRDFYPPEIFTKQTPSPATDVFMIVKTTIAMLGGDPATGKCPDSVPKPLQNLFASCLIASPSKRTDDAWKLHDDLDEILLNLVGKPKYRALPMPPLAKA